VAPPLELEPVVLMAAAAKPDVAADPLWWGKSLVENEDCVDDLSTSDKNSAHCYAYERSWCGKYDDHDFTSTVQCCICEHGQGLKEEQVEAPKIEGKGAELRVPELPPHKPPAEAAPCPDRVVVRTSKSLDKTASFACAVLLLGNMFFVLCLFYLVNSSNAALVASTWDILNGMMSIFITISMFMAMTNVWDLLFLKDGEMPDRTHPGAHGLLLADQGGGSRGQMLFRGPHNKTLEVEGVALIFLRFLVVAALLPLTLYQFRRRPLALGCWGLFGGHFLGFAGSEACAELLSMDFFARATWRYAGGVAALVVLVVLAIVLTSWGRNHLIPHNENLHSWDHQCEHQENEGYGFVLGLLISMSLRFKITGSVPALHGSPAGKTPMEIIYLFGVLVVSFVLHCAFALGLQLRGSQAGRVTRRVADLAKMTIAMNFGWVCLYWTEWLFWFLFDPKEEFMRMLTYMFVALTTSIVVFASIVIVDFTADRKESWAAPLQDLKLPIILNLGFSWEMVFYLSGSDVSNKLMSIAGVSASSKLNVLGGTGMLVLMVLVTLPAWVWYVFPRAQECKMSVGNQASRPALGHSQSALVRGPSSRGSRPSLSRGSSVYSASP